MFGNAKARMHLSKKRDRHAARHRARRLGLESLENRQLLAELAQLRLTATDLSGQPVTTLLQGQEYYLNALVKDLRASPVGVFSAYFDLTANDNSLLTVIDQAGGIGGVVFSQFYADGRESINSMETASREIDDVGAFTQEKYFGDEKLLFTMRFRADAEGTLQFGTNSADDFGHVFSLRQHGTLAETEVSFGTLSLQIVNNVALANDSATVAEDAAATTVNVLTNDPGGSATWTIQSISEISSGGTIQITNGGKSISYRPAADFFGTETFKYQATNGSGVPGEATVTVTVTPVNDAPRNQFPPANKRITDEDTAITFAHSTGNHIGIWDDQVAPATDRVNLFALDGGNIFLPNLSTLISQGKITLEGGANNTSSMQIRGLTADVNTALDGMQFTPKSNFFTVSPSQVARIRLWTREVGSPAPLLQADNTFEITVNSINDAPVNAVPAAQVANGSRVVTFDSTKRISTSDVDVGASNMRVTLQVASGILTLGSASGIAFQSGANNSASMTIQGTLTNVNNALLNLKYTGNAGATSDVLTVTSNDLGSSGSGGAKTDQDTIAISIPAQNQAPVNTVPGPQTFNSTDRTVIFDSTKRISTNDPDVGANKLRVTLFVNGGILKLSQTTGLTFLGSGADNTRYLLFDGTQADVNAALLGLKYTANVGKTSDVLTVDVNDLGNTGSGGSKIDRDTIALTVAGQAANQAPVNTVPGPQTFPTSTRQVTFDSTKRISTNDPDVGANKLRVTVFVNSGIITLSTTNGLTFLNGANNTRYLLFDGTQSAVNAALLNMKYTANTGTTTDVLTLDVNDLGNTGTGGSKIDRDTVSLTQQGFGPNGRSGGSGSGEAGSGNRTASGSSQGSASSDEVFAQSASSQTAVVTPPVTTAARLAELLASSNSGRGQVTRSTDAIFGEIA